MCALHLQAKIDLNASGFKAGANQAAASIETLERDAKAARDMLMGMAGAGDGAARSAHAIAETQRQLALELGGVRAGLIAANQSHAAFASGASAASESAGVLGRSLGLARHQVQNLGYQITDIGTQLAGGSSPFLIMAQQGPQVVDALGGIGGAARAAGVALKFLFTNPIGLAVTGVATLATAMATLSTKTTSAEEAQNRYKTAIERARELTRSAVENARELAKAKAQEAIETSKAAQAAERDTLAKMLAGRQRLLEQIAALQANINKGWMVDQSKQMLPGLEKTLGGLDKEVEKTFGRIVNLQNELYKLQNPPTGSTLKGMLDGVGKGAEDATDAVRTFEDVLGDLAREGEALRGARTAEALDLLGSVAEQGLSPMERYAEQVNQVRQVMAALTASGYQFAAGFPEAVERGLQSLDPAMAAIEAEGERQLSEHRRRLEEAAEATARMSEDADDDCAALFATIREAGCKVYQFVAKLFTQTEAPHECH